MWSKDWYASSNDSKSKVTKSRLEVDTPGANGNCLRFSFEHLEFQQWFQECAGIYSISLLLKRILGAQILL